MFRILELGHRYFLNEATIRAGYNGHVIFIDMGCYDILRQFH